MDLFTITEPTVSKSKGKTRQDIINTVQKKLKQRIEQNKAILPYYNNDTGKYQDAIIVRYGSKPVKTFWANAPLETAADKNAFSEAVYNYVPNFKDTLWEMFKVRAEINRNNALKRTTESEEGQQGTALVASS